MLCFVVDEFISFLMFLSFSIDAALYFLNNLLINPTFLFDEKIILKIMECDKIL